MFKLPVLDFKKCSFLDEEVVEFHYGKHHRAYVDNLNNLTNGKQVSLFEIIKTEKGSVYNNAGQVFNHTFYWLCLTPEKSKLNVNTAFESQVKSDFNDFKNLKESFIKSALALFGSGWTFHKF